MRSFAMPDRTEIGGFVLLAGTALFLTLDAAAEMTYPGFDPRHDPLSRLGETTSPTRLLWSTSLLILAVAWLVGVATVLRPRRSRLLVFLNFVPAAGLIVAVLVPLDADLAIHEVGAFTAFLGGILAILADAEVLHPTWRAVSSGLAGMAVFALSPFAARLITIVGWGGVERMVVYPLVAAVGVFGLAVLLGGQRTALEGRARRSATLGLIVVAIVAGILGLGTGLTAGGYEVVFGRTAILVETNIVLEAPVSILI